MRNIFLFLLFIATGLATYYLTSLFCWSINDLTYKQTLQHSAHLFGLATIYWMIPAYIVASIEEN